MGRSFFQVNFGFAGQVTLRCQRSIEYWWGRTRLRLEKYCPFLETLFQGEISDAYVEFQKQ
jgi:hypothetical protein